MQTGPGNVKIPPGCRLVIRCSKKFTALGLDAHQELKAILGPRAEGDRTLTRIVPPDVCTLKMQTPKTAHWSYETTDRHQGEDLDLTPVEIPVDTGPLDYHAEMRRIVRDEMSLAADAAGKETFEEADDFDLEDDDPATAYEITQMQQDELFEPPAEPPPEEETEKPDHRPVGDPPEKQPPAAEKPENPASP